MSMQRYRTKKRNDSEKNELKCMMLIGARGLCHEVTKCDLCERCVQYIGSKSNESRVSRVGTILYCLDPNDKTSEATGNISLYVGVMRDISLVV